MSEQVFADLDRAERLLFEDQRNLALGALETTGEQCFLVHGVTDSYQVLIERQAELLATTPDRLTGRVSARCELARDWFEPGFERTAKPSKAPQKTLTSSYTMTLDSRAASAPLCALTKAH